MEINATILVSAISFLVFIFIMNKILYKPVLDIMEKRQNYIDSNKSDADEQNKKAEALLKDKDEKLSATQRKSRDIVASKADALKEEKAKVLTDTKDTVNQYFNEQKENLSNQKNEVSANMQSDVADLANHLTSKLMGDGVSFEPLSKDEVDEVMKKNA